MGLFKKLFGKKKEIETLNITLDLLPIVIQKDFEAKIKDLELNSAKELSQIKYLYEKAKTLLDDIKTKELEEKENGRLNKAALTSKAQIEKQLQRILDKIDPKPIGNNLDEIRAYSNKSYALLISEINNFRKSILYTSIYLKDEMKEFGQTLQEILNKLHLIKTNLEKEKSIFEFEKVKIKIGQIKTNEVEITNIEKNLTSITNNIAKKEAEIKNIETEITKINESSEMAEVKRVELHKSKLLEEKQELKTEISSMMATIDRPLQRFQSLVNSGRWILDKEDQTLLNNFLTNPLLALKQDINGQKFKLILGEIVKAINQGQIELKDKDKERRLDALGELINFNFFEKVFWKLNEIQKQQVAIDNEFKTNLTLQNIKLKETNLSQVNKEIEKLQNAIKLENHKINQINDTILIETQKIVVFGETALNKKIVIKSN